MTDDNRSHDPDAETRLLDVIRDGLAQHGHDVPTDLIAETIHRLGLTITPYSDRVPDVAYLLSSLCPGLSEYDVYRVLDAAGVILLPDHRDAA